MANLFAQNIGLNYRGILNLDGSTINTPLDTTLRAVTDGVGTSSTLLLSTTLARVSSNFIIGGATSASARLHVRGDGTNPFARFEDTSGTPWVQIGLVSGSPTINFANGSYLQTDGSVSNFYTASQRVDYLTYQASGSYALSSQLVNNINPTSGTRGVHQYSSTFAAPAGSANYRNISLEYTINNSGAQTGTATGIFLNATETNLNGMGHNLMDLRAGGVSRLVLGRTHDAAFRFNNIAAASNWRPLFSLSRIGGVGTPALSFGVGLGGASSSAYIASSNDELYLGTDLSNTFTTNIVLKANSVGFIGLGGLTSSFPAIARSSANMIISLADAEAGSSLGVGMSVATGVNASAVLQADSTTKGFLPPRMTTAQRDLIGSPAAGLVIYNTTTNLLNFYNGSVWGAV